MTTDALEKMKAIQRIARSFTVDTAADALAKIERVVGLTQESTSEREIKPRVGRDRMARTGSTRSE